MVVTTVLWRYWQKQQYEEAITEVCALLDVKEESFSSDQELLAAAGDTEPPIRPIPGSFPTGEAENLANLALFGCSCCNRLAERVRKDGRVAAHWCALARCLEAAGDGAGPWAMVRFERLFHAAEAIRVAGKEVLKHDETGRLTLPDYHLRASHRCLRECESIWLRWPSCTSKPESIYTCLAEVCWQLKDTESVRSSCRKALSLMSDSVELGLVDTLPRCLTPAKVYACMFVLWVFQSAAVDVFSWREVRAALHCARDMFQRLQAIAVPQDLRPHTRLLKRLQRQGSVVAMAPVDLAEAKQELGLNYKETLDSFAVHGRSDSDRKGEVAVMTDLEVGPETLPPSRPPPVRFEDQCAEIMAFLESIDAEALSASRKKGCLDNLLSAAEAAMNTDMDKGLDLGLDRTWEAPQAPKVEGEVPASKKTPRRWTRRSFKATEIMEEHPRPWLSVPFVIEAWQCHSVDGRAEGQDAVDGTRSVTAELPKAEPLLEPPSPATPPVRSATESTGGPVSRHRVARKPAVPLAPRREGARSTRSMESMSCDRPTKTGSRSLHDDLECPPPWEKRERRKAPLPKWSPRPSSGYTRPAASLRPAVPIGCRPSVSGQSAECSTNASCSSGSTEVLSRPTVSQQCNKASSTSLSILSTVPPEPVDVDAGAVPWAFRGIRRQIEAPHLHFGHIPRMPAFDVH